MAGNNFRRLVLYFIEPAKSETGKSTPGLYPQYFQDRKRKIVRIVGDTLKRSLHHYQKEKSQEIKLQASTLLNKRSVPDRMILRLKSP
jgi:hypothetical protein